MLCYHNWWAILCQPPNPFPCMVSWLVCWSVCYQTNSSCMLCVVGGNWVWLFIGWQNARATDSVSRCASQFCLCSLVWYDRSLHYWSSFTLFMALTNAHYVNTFRHNIFVLCWYLESFCRFVCEKVTLKKKRNSNCGFLSTSLTVFCPRSFLKCNTQNSCLAMQGWSWVHSLASCMKCSLYWKPISSWLSFDIKWFVFWGWGRVVSFNLSFVTASPIYFSSCSLVLLLASSLSHQMSFSVTVSTLSGTRLSP